MLAWITTVSLVWLIGYPGKADVEICLLVQVESRAFSSVGVLWWLMMVEVPVRSNASSPMTRRGVGSGTPSALKHRIGREDRELYDLIDRAVLASAA